MTRALAHVLALVVLLSSALPVLADEPDLATTSIDSAADYAPDRVVVRYRDAGKADAAAQRRGLAVLASLDTPGSPVVLGTRGRPVATVLAELRGDPAVAWAEPDYIVHLADPGIEAVAVNDPMTNQQYSLDRMRVRDAWSVTTGSTTDVVAVLDTGVQANHPELSGRVLTGRNFTVSPATKNTADDNGHGTWVSGIIAAHANNAKGIAGINWNAKILPLKIMNKNGTGTTTALNSAITWVANWAAARPDRRVTINMSVGGFPYTEFVEDTVDYAFSKGVVLVGAAGNNRREENFYPASYDNVISVSATQADDEFTNWSSFGPKVDVSAPGASILTTNCTVSPCVYSGIGGYITISGTSFATPNVAGVVSLIRAWRPGWTPSQVVSRLYATVDDLGYAGRDIRYGRGRVNAWRAVGGSPPQVPIASGDALEPNNGLASAKRISLDTTVRPSIHPAGDVDFLYARAPAAGRLTFTVSPVIDTVRVPKSSLPVDPVVSLYNAAGAHLKTVDNPTNSAATEQASVTLSAAGRIYVRVSNWFPNGTKDAYSIRVTFKPAETGGVTRISGTDRFATAANVSKASFSPGVPVVALATGNDFPDALAGAPLAGTRGGPVLLVTRDRIPATTAAELKRLAPKRIVLLGGSGVIGDAVRSAARQYTSGNVSRLAGPDRYATAAAVSAAFAKPGLATVYVATGENFPDALAGAALAARDRSPVLLTGRTAIPAVTRAELTRLKPGRIVVLGGTGVVTSSVASALRSFAPRVLRLAGSDRYGTAAAISAYGYAADDVSTAYVATGMDFPDALAGAAVAGIRGSPVLLTDPKALPAVIRNELVRLRLTQAVIVGGSGNVSDKVRSAIVATLQ